MIRLLDCTLRDGGFINQWRFGREKICRIFNHLVTAGVETIEIGYLRDNVADDLDCTRYPHTDSVQKMRAGLDKKQSKIAAMIEFGTFSLDNLAPAAQTGIDLIRITVTKDNALDSLPFVTEVLARGYAVALQPVSVTAWDKDAVLELGRVFSSLPIASVAVVDTYGLLHWEQANPYFALLNAAFDERIALGYHGHNNFQMAYSNAIQLCGFPTNRDIVIDTSLFGMGKSAGNTPLELMAMYLNKAHGKQYDLTAMMDIIESDILPFYGQASWGYSLKNYRAALQGEQPDYATDDER